MKTGINQLRIYRSQLRKLLVALITFFGDQFSCHTKNPQQNIRATVPQLIQKCVLLANHILLTEVIYINLLNGCSPRGNEIFSTICKTILNISISSCFLCFGSYVNSGISDFYSQNQLNFGYVAFLIFLDTSFSLIHIRQQTNNTFEGQGYDV